MLARLFRSVNGTMVAPQNPGEAFLRKRLPCKVRGCGAMHRLVRFVPLHPAGVRGYYSCPRGHVVALNRDGVTRMTKQSPDRIWFAR